MYRMCLLLASVSLVDINECGLVGPDYNILSLLYVTIIITVLINARGGVPAGIVVVSILLFLFHAL